MKGFSFIETLVKVPSLIRLNTVWLKRNSKLPNGHVKKNQRKMKIANLSSVGFKKNAEREKRPLENEVAGRADKGESQSRGGSLVEGGRGGRAGRGRCGCRVGGGFGVGCSKSRSRSRDVAYGSLLITHLVSRAALQSDKERDSRWKTPRQ